MSTKLHRPWFIRVMPDVCAFALGLGAAYFLKWETRDLVWSLWLCSLVTGYLTLLSALAAGAYAGFVAITDKTFKPELRMPAVAGGLAIGLFLLGFFSLHFCGFHAGHSVFLQLFFPLEGMPSDGFGRAFMNPPLLWVLVFRHLIRPYGIFLIPTLIAERRHVFRPIAEAVKAMNAEKGQKDFSVGRTSSEKPDIHMLGNFMGRPYLNVVRMHLLIFFFAFAHALKADSFLVYTVVYAVYFFPWREVMRPRLASK